MKTISKQAQVTKKDQQIINNFSKMYSLSQQYQTQLTELKQKVQKHDDTLTEMQLNDDEDTVRYRFGSCFFYMPTDRARELVEEDMAKVKKDLDEKAKEKFEVDKKVKNMKATLYGKFGNAINLEE